MDKEIKKLCVCAESYSRDLDSILSEMKKVVVGQDEILRNLVLSLIADGHVLLEGVPGLAKTLMIKTLASTISSSFCRIQFTPDLLPADIIGTKIYDHKKTTFITRKGPIFHNFILADEINRAPPKVQSALLEAMQERQVTIQGDTFALESPFFVLATQNPVETEGTYRLPEAQIDRFMFKLIITYPTKDEEKIIIRRMTGEKIGTTGKVLSPARLLEMQQFNRRIYADEKIEEYVTRLVDATRSPEKYGLAVKSLIEYGASPRASIWLVMAGKARALMCGRGYVLPEDIKSVSHEVLRHRIMLSYEADAEEVTSDNIIDEILGKVKLP